MALLGNLTGSAQYFNDDDFYSGTVTQSLRLDSGSSNHLYWTPSASSTSTRTFTVSTWVKLGNLKTGSDSFIWCGQNVSGTTNCDLNFKTSSGEYYFQIGANGQSVKNTSELRRDVSAWYHLVAVFDTTQGTDTNRIKLYVNGEQRSISGTFPSQNTDFDIGGSNKQMIGALNLGSAGRFFDGYIGEFNFVDGQALTPTSFGETKNGVWIPKTYRGAYGTNGFRLQFNQVGVGTASTSTIGADTSGNTNHFTSSGIVASDCAMPDSPENNFCTINSIREDTLQNGSVALSEGNLQSVDASSTYSRHWSGTFGMSTGKWYWEVLAHTLGGNSANIGLGNDTEKQSVAVSSGSINVYYGSDGKRNPRAANTGTTNYGATYADDDIIGIAFDADNETVQFYKNNAGQGAVGSILVQATGPYFPSVGDGQNATTYKYVANFGQDSSFAGNKTAQGNTDGNSIGDFYYTPPSGYLALCTANLPEPTIGPNSDTQADDHFNTVLYSGDDSTNAITVGLKPDFVWLKKRSATSSHRLYNSSTYGGPYSAGASGSIYLKSNATTADTAGSANSLISMDTNGFTVHGTGGDTNADGSTYVAWNWKANGGTTTTNDASSTGIGTIDSVFQANTTAGFSIVTYTGNSTAGATVRHGLTVAPEMVIVKSRTSAHNWVVYHKGQGVDKYIELNLTTASQAQSSYNMFNSTAPTSSVFTIGSLVNTNTDKNYIAYCFHPVEGYSKFGSYTGNGSADGTFVALNFRPSWIIFKRTDSANSWLMLDNQRDTDNPVHKFLHANETAAEDTSNDQDVDFTSNGFKIRNANARNNASGGSYIYMAFAEAPFKYANAR